MPQAQIDAAEALLAPQYAGGTTASESRISRYMSQISDGAEALTASRAAKREAKFAPHAKFTNWAEIGGCHPSRHFTPSSTEEVATIIKRLYRQSTSGAPGGHTEVKVAGGGASPNDMAFTNQHMIHMSANMNKVISVDPKAMQVTVEAGASMKHLLETLEASNLMIACIPSYTSTPTVGGCIATGMHGSGVDTKILGAYVVRMTVVNGKGEVKIIDRERTPQEWAHWACHIGVLGVVTEVTLQAERSTLWHKREQPISVKEAVASMVQRARFNDYYRLLFVPYTEMCYETLMRRAAPADEEHVDVQSASARSAGGASKLATKGFFERQQDKTWRDAKGVVTVTHDPHLTQRLWEKDNAEQQKFISTISGLLPDPRLAKMILSNPLMAVQHTFLERALYAAAILNRTKTPLQQFLTQQGLGGGSSVVANRSTSSSTAVAAYKPSTAASTTSTPHHLQATINQAYQRAFLNENVENFGTASAMMTMDCLFKQYTSEWAIPANKAVAALQAIPVMIQEHNLQGVHFPVEFRFVAASNQKDRTDAKAPPLITLDPCRKGGIDASGGEGDGIACFVGAVMFRPLGQDAPETHTFLNAFNQLMRELGGRPHWAKYYHLSGADLATLYPPRPATGAQGWRQFDQYRGQSDPAGLFVNDWFEKFN